MLHFNVKSFIFSHEPSEWSFGCEEKMNNLKDQEHDQMIDITDDVTGKTHDIARKNIPMYVNEVGHNRNLTQNVLARERNCRSVHYFINIVQPMAMGSKVELLTSYTETYEE